MQHTYLTHVMVWSRNGHTPITNRGGAYCDELVNTYIECTDPDDALEKVAAIKAATKHAYACYFNMKEYPNQNTKRRFCHYG